MKEKKDRVDDALNATRAAVRGIVPGAVLRFSMLQAHSKIEGDNSDQKVGVSIVRQAREAPVRQIAENAGVDSAVVAGKLLEGKGGSFGFDAQSEKYTDLVKAGIVDPTKVVRTAYRMRQDF